MTAKLSIGNAWTEAASFVRRERKLIAPIALAMIFVPVVISDLIQPSSAATGTAEPGAWTLVALAALVIGMIAQLAVMRLAMGWQGSVGDVIKRAARRIWTVLGALLITGCLIALIALPLIVLVMLAAGNRVDDPRVLTWISLLFALAVMAALARVLPLTALAMDGDEGPWRLLRKTFALTRGNYWRLLAFFTLFLIASLLLGGAVTSVVGSVATLLVGPPGPLTVSRLLIALASGLVQSVVLSVYAAMIGRIAVQLTGGASSGT